MRRIVISFQGIVFGWLLCFAIIYAPAVLPFALECILYTKYTKRKQEKSFLTYLNPVNTFF